MNSLLRLFILWTTGAAAGASLWTAWSRRRKEVGLSVLLLGYVLLILLIGYLVYQVPFVANDWKSWTWVTGLVLVVLGFVLEGPLKRKGKR